LTVPRVLAVIAALGLAVAVLISPAPVEAKPNSKPPHPHATPTPTPAPSPTPKPSPTATPTPSPTPSPAPAFLDGIDVSYHQGAIEWARVADANKAFAFVRASAGTLTADVAYDTNLAGARAAGVAVGSYHFGNPDSGANDALNEARWFVQNASVESGDLVPVLDLEVSNGLGAAALTTWAKTWLTEVETATGVRPLIYTTPNFWSSSMTNTDWFARNGYRVWIAHWTTASQPSVPAGNWAGDGWTFWQHSSTGSVPGVNGPVDVDRFNGDALPGSLVVP
jgi:GH25 family lysozyme M1 (1,4-beta-N-acetylmuramidase)